MNSRKTDYYLPSLSIGSLYEVKYWVSFSEPSIKRPFYINNLEAYTRCKINDVLNVEREEPLEPGSYIMLIDFKIDRHPGSSSPGYCASILYNEYLYTEQWLYEEEWDERFKKVETERLRND